MKRAFCPQACVTAVISVLLPPLPVMAASSAATASEPGSVDFVLGDRSRLEALQFRIDAQRGLMDWVRARTQETTTSKYEKEKARVGSAFDAIVRDLRKSGRDRHKRLIQDLESYVLKYSQTQASGDLYLRLAELYFEQANYTYIEQMEAYEKAAEAFYKGERSSEPDLPKPDYSRAIELYSEFVKAFPQHRYIREATYLYAYTLEESGDEDEAVRLYEKLLEMDPTGPLAPEVAFRVGEYYFLTGDLDLAAKSYRHALKLKDETFFDKALYKLAWTYYRMSDFDRALLGFVELIDYTQAATEAATGMRDESMQYIAIIFSERDGLPGLLAFFDKIGGRKYLNEVVAKLGDIYFETADYAKAIKVYRELLERLPLEKNAPEIGRRIEQCLLKLEAVGELVQEKKRFAKTFGPGSRWYARWSAADAQYVQPVSAEAEKKLYEYALYFHSEGQKAGDAEVRLRNYREALAGYEDFEAQFPASKRLGEAVFNRAEIHYELHEWVQAGRLYQRVPDIIMNPTSPIFEEASWNMILSYRKALDEFEQTGAGRARVEEEAAYRRASERAAEEAQKAATAPPVTATERKARADIGGTEKRLPSAAEDLIKASIYYVRLYPLGGRSPAVYYNTGEILFRYGLYARAREQYVSFIERFPDNEFLMDAIKQTTRTYLIQESFGELVSWGYNIMESPLANRPEVRAYFTTILSGAIFKDAQQLEKKGELVKAAETYLGMIERFPESEFVDEALINAGVAYQKYGDWDSSTQVYLRFYRQFPTHPYAPKALFQTAWNAERVLDFNAAVSRYVEMLDVYPKAADAKDALFNAATILAKLGEARRAAELYLLYIKRFPGEIDEADNLFFAAKAYYDDGDYATADQVFDRFAKHPRRNEREVEAEYYRAQIALKRQQDKAYWDNLDLVLKAYDRWTAAGKAVDPSYAAEAAFRKAEREDAEYRAIKLRLPMSVMEKQLDKKAKELKKVVEVYTGVVKYKDPLWSSAALHKIGEAYQHFAESLFSAPIPPELDEEEADVYKMELEEQAFPIEEQAMEGFKRNLDLALRLGIDNEWVRKSRDVLIKLFPDTARIKESERQAVASNDFFYTFKGTKEKDDEVRIDGYRVVYVKTPYRVENIEERYKIAARWTKRQRKVVFAQDMETPVILIEGKPVELRGIRELWAKHYHN